MVKVTRPQKPEEPEPAPATPSKSQSIAPDASQDTSKLKSALDVAATDRSVEQANAPNAGMSLSASARDIPLPGPMTDALAVMDKLREAKAEAVSREDFEEARRLKDQLAHMEEIPGDLKRLEMQKREAVEKEEYEIAAACKRQIINIQEWMAALKNSPNDTVMPPPSFSMGAETLAPRSPQGRTDLHGKQQSHLAPNPPQMSSAVHSPASASSRAVPIDSHIAPGPKSAFSANSPGDMDERQRLEAELKAAQWELRCWQLAADLEGMDDPRSSQGERAQVPRADRSRPLPEMGRRGPSAPDVAGRGASSRQGSNRPSDRQSAQSSVPLPSDPGTARQGWEENAQVVSLEEGDAVIVREDFGEVTSDYGLRVWLRKGQKGTVMALCDDGGASINFGGHSRLVPRHHIAKLAVTRRRGMPGTRSGTESAIDDLRWARDNGTSRNASRPVSAGAMQGAAARALRTRPNR